jgi:hypothetical protein
MQDMSNLHEVQTVDMLPPDMNSQFQQVKPSFAIIWHFLLHAAVQWLANTSASGL